MSYNIYFSEKDWAFKQAELTRELEHRRMVKEARAARISRKASQEQTGPNSTETKATQKVGKETLGWN